MSSLTPADIDRTAELVRVLDSATRLELLLLLDEGEHVVHQLVDELQKSQPLISQHLRVLRKAGLVSSSRQGREVVYALAEPDIINVIHDLASIAALDAARDELAQRRAARKNAAEPDVPATGAAIIDAPKAWRPEQDPGLAPQTPRPERD